MIAKRSDEPNPSQSIDAEIHVIASDKILSLAQALQTANTESENRLLETFRMDMEMLGLNSNQVVSILEELKTQNTALIKELNQIIALFRPNLF